MAMILSVHDTYIGWKDGHTGPLAKPRAATVGTAGKRCCYLRGRKRGGELSLFIYTEVFSRRRTDLRTAGQLWAVTDG